METGLEVEMLPAASRARAARVWAPAVVVAVFQEMAYGAVVSSDPSVAPSSRNWTPATPTLSVALAATGIVPVRLDPARGEVTDAIGGVVSDEEPMISS